MGDWWTGGNRLCAVGCRDIVRARVAGELECQHLVLVGLMLLRSRCDGCHRQDGCGRWLSWKVVIIRSAGLTWLLRVDIVVGVVERRDGWQRLVGGGICGLRGVGGPESPGEPNDHPSEKNHSNNRSNNHTR